MTAALSLSPETVPPETAPHGLALGAVTLSSRDPERLIPFYRDGVGLDVLSTGETTVLGAGGRPLVEIARRPDAARAAVRAPGLFHMAIRVPDRASLAARLLALHHMGLRMGASDHLVSEALYVDDPDGNGIEIYRDRPADEWPRSADGTIAMATLPLDLNDLAREAPPAAQPAPAGTDMGHVHLKVSDLDAARRFWVDTVGLTIMARYPGALFVSADGYHHHLGLNTWQSSGAPAPAAGTAGLDHFTVRLPLASIEALGQRLAAAGVAFAALEGGGLTVRDPSGNTAVFRPA
ncbi:VOC family protein [Xanthobacter oligotrophicus]|uniref:VOC family protein n=1 Tax=Xanthobacter oligotrophicus TaxID=2607286 RepID=UPI0011F0E633|nr:VOC family protein [Xanthobacter oligotrophicus]MCG5237014.1 VOC family protein [Xanthobacter oligotrophicus]